MNVVEIVTTVTNCARCGNDHASLSFQPLDRMSSIDKVTITHWAVCPVSKQPIWLGTYGG